MRQPWIHNAKSDFWWILSPPFIILLIIFLFQNQIETLQSESNFYVWLFLIVFVDVSHVYSTLFKTYFVKKEVQSRKLLYYGLPIFSFVFGVILFQFGSLVFWSVLALLQFFILFVSNMVLCDCMPDSSRIIFTKNHLSIK